MIIIPDSSTSMRQKWQKRIQKRREASDSESDDEVLYKETNSPTSDRPKISRNASNKALEWEKKFQVLSFQQTNESFKMSEQLLRITLGNSKREANTATRQSNDFRR